MAKMGITRTVSVLQGFNHTPYLGKLIKDPNQDFVRRGVVAGVSVVRRVKDNVHAVVTTVTPDTIETAGDWFADEWFELPRGHWFSATGIEFEYGDFYEVTLVAPWVVQNSDSPILDVECRRCGFSYPKKELQNGLCEECIDEDAHASV